MQQFLITTSFMKNRDLSYPLIGRVVQGQEIVTGLVKGDVIKQITIEGDPSRLLKKYAKNVAEWNAAMKANPTKPGVSATR